MNNDLNDTVATYTCIGNIESSLSIGTSILDFDTNQSIAVTQAIQEFYRRLS